MKKSKETQRTYTLVISCPDRVGIVSAVSQFISDHKGWIIEADYHSDTEADWFFMRQEILAETLKVRDLQDFKEKFDPLARRYKMKWHITDSAKKKRVMILVSKQDHCLSDLLYRWRTQEFRFDITCIVSNHEINEDFVKWHGIPFHHIPVDSDNKTKSFKQIEKLFHEYEVDLMVLARYMQIIPQGLCKRLEDKIINIHHSFLPSFIGGKPYHRAYEKGVKLIGATCHYITKTLDEGPIIEQDVIRVDHSHSVNDMIRLGKDVEKTVLAHGLRYHVEDRVIRHKNKTVVFK